MTPRITPGLLRSVRKGNLLFSEGESRLARVGYGISGFVNCSAIDETDGSGPTMSSYAMRSDTGLPYPAKEATPYSLNDRECGTGSVGGSEKLGPS